MTTDQNGQGLIDFSQAFRPNRKSVSAMRKRPRVKDSEAVPEWEVAALQGVRVKAGLSCMDISEAMGLIEEGAHGGFVNRVLSGRQKVNREDFTRIYLATAKVVFGMILDSEF